MFDGNPGEIDFGSSYRESTVHTRTTTSRYFLPVITETWWKRIVSSQKKSVIYLRNRGSTMRDTNKRQTVTAWFPSSLNEAGISSVWRVSEIRRVITSRCKYFKHELHRREADRKRYIYDKKLRCAGSSGACAPQQKHSKLAMVLLETTIYFQRWLDLGTPKLRTSYFLCQAWKIVTMV